MPSGTGARAAVPEAATPDPLSQLDSRPSGRHPPGVSAVYSSRCHRPRQRRGHIASGTYALSVARRPRVPPDPPARVVLRSQYLWLPMAEAHRWREVTNADIARNFYERSMTSSIPR